MSTSDFWMTKAVIVNHIYIYIYIYIYTHVWQTLVRDKDTLVNAHVASYTIVHGITIALFSCLTPAIYALYSILTTSRLRLNCGDFM